jgi:hypothetical protein
MNPLVTTRFAKSDIKIRCERRMEYPGSTTVRIGHTVSPNQVLARIREQVKFYIVPGSKLLGVPPAEITDYLLVEIGGSVDLGDPLLQKKGVFGGKTIKAPVTGTVSSVQNGRIILESAGRLTELRAMVQGRVTNFIGNHTVVIETQGTLMQGVWGTDVETVGPLKMAVDHAAQPLDAGSFKKHENHILVAGAIHDEALLEQAAFAEVNGLIVGAMPSHLCDVARRLQLPLILTDGIGSHQMSQRFFDLLGQQAGRETSLLRAANDNRRPQIVVAHEVALEQLKPPAYEPLAVGQTVRLLRAPHKGKVGQVAQLLTTARTVETGIKTHGAMVALDEDQTVFVPYSNMEAIL